MSDGIANDMNILLQTVKKRTYQKRQSFEYYYSEENDFI